MAPRQRKSNTMLSIKLSIVLIGGWVIASFASVEQPSSSRLMEMNNRINHTELELIEHSQRIQALEDTMVSVN